MSQRVDRPCKITPKIDHRIHHLSGNNRFCSAIDIVTEINNNNGIEISVRTIKRRLKDFQLRGQKAWKKLMLSAKNRKIRLAFAKTHRN